MYKSCRAHTKEMGGETCGVLRVMSRMSFRRGYQQGVIDVFYTIERFLDPTTREVLKAWIEKDVSIWRVKAMLGHPPNWRLNMIAGPRSEGRALDRLDLRYAAADIQT
jgi:hypothetical protein